MEDPDTGNFILAGHSRTKAFSDLAEGNIEFSDKYNKSDFANNSQIVDEQLEDTQNSTRK
jgi:hypothetical protein